VIRSIASHTLPASVLFAGGARRRDHKRITLTFDDEPDALTMTSVVLGGDSLSVPTQDRFRRRQRGHLGQQLSSERLASLGEQPPLGVSESQTPQLRIHARRNMGSIQALEYNR
jgi:hypothetical protein